jgi:uncharacterized protein YyaL (SSP411 family)
MAAKPHANHLMNETSPYLLQHAHNPVDWYPWGEEALERARLEDKPVLLSIGYSSCHWCHVMERESFENESIADLMNKHFICIKVDREELPDIDRVYMEAVQAMTGGGGWPLTVFLTPGLEPFHGGTYFPPEDRLGLPGFPRVLSAVAEAYRSSREDVAAAAGRVTTYLKEKSAISSPAGSLSAEIIRQSYSAIADSFDHKNGGFGPGPKFPQPLLHEFLLHIYHRTKDEKALNMVRQTLDNMAAGGIYDHLGGGFHRYAVDERWVVPHFEKMLYDNALLSRLYLHGYQASRNVLYRRIAEETLEYVLTEMTGPRGAFYSAQDADSEGTEGKYYVWTPGEIMSVLGREAGEPAIRYFGVTQRGNFEGSNVLHSTINMAEFAASSSLETDEAQKVIDRARSLLLAARKQRARPNVDTKVLTSWNALMLRSFAEAATALSNGSYAGVAVSNAEFLLREMRTADGLMHVWAEGKARIPGYLDDHAFLITGLLALHEATFEQRWLKEAISLTNEMIARFADEERSGVMFDTSKDHRALLVRPRDTADSVIPSGSSSAADVLLRIAVITGEDKYHDLALAMLASVREQMVKHPFASAKWLCSLDFALSGPIEVTMVGDPAEAGIGRLMDAVCRRYLPNRVLLGRRPDEQLASHVSSTLTGRVGIDGHPTAYLCHDRTCQPPVTDVASLASLLDRLTP